VGNVEELMEYCTSITVSQPQLSTHMAKVIQTSHRGGCPVMQSTHSCSVEANTVSSGESGEWKVVEREGSQILWETDERTLFRVNAHSKTPKFSFSFETSVPIEKPIALLPLSRRKAT
jgi:hypothetical protein